MILPSIQVGSHKVNLLQEKFDAWAKILYKQLILVQSKICKNVRKWALR